jgi:alkanesulfonate monooxygenase SsuD/methylene tetrahydromethanopterin reductase-like flavin-dependent oxidoreductase (luciferase family)
VFQEFATLDLISKGRAEIVVGRGSFGEAFPLFGLQAEDYNDLFTEKLDLLLTLQKSVNVHWNGRHRPTLTGQGVYPRPFREEIPVWLGVGGTPQSFVRAGLLGLPLMVAIIGGEFRRFRPLVDLYRQAYRESGHPEEGMKVGVHAFGFVGETDDAARDTFFPGWFQMFTQIGRERGWPAPSRAQFDALCSEGGAYLIGDPTTVAAKVMAAREALGGIQRLTFQKSSALVRHEQMKNSIRLLGNQVAPLVRAKSGMVA